jgi:hypothetical protein
MSFSLHTLLSQSESLIGPLGNFHFESNSKGPFFIGCCHFISTFYFIFAWISFVTQLDLLICFWVWTCVPSFKFNTFESWCCYQHLIGFRSFKSFCSLCVFLCFTSCPLFYWKFPLFHAKFKCAGFIHVSLLNHSFHLIKYYLPKLNFKCLIWFTPMMYSTSPSSLCPRKSKHGS